MPTTLNFGELGIATIEDTLDESQIPQFLAENGDAIRAALLRRRQEENEARTREEFAQAPDTFLEEAGSAAAQLGREAAGVAGKGIRGAASVMAASPVTRGIADFALASMATPAGGGMRPGTMPSITPETTARMAGAGFVPTEEAGRAIEEAGAGLPVLPASEQRIPGKFAGAMGSTLGIAPAALAGPAAPFVAGGVYGLSAGQAAADEARQATDQQIAALLAEGDWEGARALQGERESRAQLAFAATAPIGAVTEGALGVVGGAASKLPFAKRAAEAVAQRVAPRPNVKVTIEPSIMGAAEAVMDAAARRFGPRTAQAAGGAVVGGVSEALQEGSESVLSDIAAKAVYDPDRAVGAQLVEEALYGGGVGALFGGARGALSRRPVARAVPPDAPKTVTPAPPVPLVPVNDEAEVAGQGEGGVPGAGAPGTPGLLPGGGRVAGLLPAPRSTQPRVFTPPYTGPGRGVIVTPFTGATQPGSPGRQQLRRAGVEAGLFAAQGEQAVTDEFGRRVATVDPSILEEGLGTAETENVSSPIDEAILDGTLKRQLNLPENVANSYSLAGAISGRYLNGENVDPDVLSALDEALPNYLRTLEGRINGAIERNVNEREVDALIGLHQRLTQFGVERRNDAAFLALQEEQRYQEWLQWAAGGRKGDAPSKSSKPIGRKPPSTPTPPTPTTPTAPPPAPNAWTEETMDADAQSVGGPGAITPGDAPGTAVLDRPAGLGRLQVITGKPWMADAPRDPDVTAEGADAGGRGGDAGGKTEGGGAPDGQGDAEGDGDGGDGKGDGGKKKGGRGPRVRKPKAPKTTEGTGKGPKTTEGVMPPTTPPPSTESTLLNADEQAEINALRAQLRSEMGKTYSFALGVNPQVFVIGVKMASVYIKAGVRKFGQYAREMKAGVPDLWDGLKPHLGNMWNSAIVGVDDAEEVTPSQARAIIAEIDKPPGRGGGTPPATPPPTTPPTTPPTGTPPPTPPPPGKPKTGRARFVEVAMANGFNESQAGTLFDNYLNDGTARLNPATGQFEINAGMETPEAMRKVLARAVPSDLLSNLKGNKLQIAFLYETSKGPAYAVTGETRKLKEFLSRAGGRWNKPLRRWEFGRDSLNALREILPKASEGGDGSQRPVASHKTDPKLRGIRERADGRPDESGDPRVLRESVSADTAGLLRAGIAQGIPENVVNEQVEDVGAIARAHANGRRLFLLGNDAGTGKTFVLGGAIRELRRKGARRIVWVTPNKDLIRQAKEDLAKFGVDDVEFMTYAKFRETPPRDTDVLVFDEAHYVKHSRDAKQGSTAQMWMRQAKFTIMASATPYEDPTQMEYVAGTGVFDEVGGFLNFAAAFGATVKRDASGEIFSVDWDETQTFMEDAKAGRDYMRKLGIFVQRPMRLPLEQIETTLVPVPIDPRYGKILDDIERVAEATATDFDFGNTQKWLKMFRKRLLEYGKVQAGIDMARQAMAEGRWPIIFLETRSERIYNIPEILEKEREFLAAKAMAQGMRDTPPKRSDFGLPPKGAVTIFEAYMNATGNRSIELPAMEDVLKEAFGPENTAIFTGSETDKGAQRELARWRQAPRPMVLVATMAKGGTGLSLHDRVGNHPTTQVNIILPWTASKVTQVTQRSARYGLKGVARINWLFVKDSELDRSLAGRVGQRMQSMGSLVRGEVPQVTMDIANFNIGEEMDTVEGEGETAAAPTQGPVSEALDNLKTAWTNYSNEAQKMGIRADPRETIRLQFKVYAALYKFAEAAIKVGAQSAADLARMAGVRLNGLVSKAWDHAKAGIDFEQYVPDDQDAVDLMEMGGFIDRLDRAAGRARAEAGDGPGAPTPPPEFQMPGTGRTARSEGLFKGRYETMTDEQVHAEAVRWVDAYGSDLEAALSDAMSGNPDLGMDNRGARNYVMLEIMARARNAAKTSPDAAVAQWILGNFLPRAAKAYSANATEAGRELGAINLAQARYSYLNPMLTLLNLIKERQRRLPFPEINSQEIREWLKGVRRRVVEEILRETSQPDNLVRRVFNRTARDMGINWREIMESSLEVQRNVYQAIYDSILAHPILSRMPDPARVELANLLGRQFQAKRDEIAKREIAKYVAPKANRKTQEALVNAFPRILKWANLGVLDDANFRDAVAPFFGVASLDSGIVQEITDMAQQAQAVGGENRKRILMDMYRRIQEVGGVRWGDVIQDYWYASVLSGTRTQVDGGMNVINGFIKTAALGLATPRKLDFFKAYGSGIADAAGDFFPILLRNDVWKSKAWDGERAPNALEALANSRNAFARVISNLKYVSRLMSALDHLNGLGTYRAGLVDALARTGNEAAINRFLTPTAKDLADARATAENEGTQPDRMKARVREIMEQQLPAEVILDAQALMKAVNYTNMPKGFAGMVYRLSERMARSEDRLATKSGAGFASKLALGTGFLRFATNMFNDYSDFMVAPAMVRWMLSRPGGRLAEEYRPIERRLLVAKAGIGAALGAFAATLFLGDDDDEDDRTIDITGSFKGLTPEKRKQLLAEGRKPYSVRVGDKYYSYRQFGFGSILGVIGELRDRQLFERDKWDQEAIYQKWADAAAAGLLVVTDSTAISGLTEFLGASNAYKYDSQEIIEKRLPRYFSRLAGSFVPNLLKEVDAWSEPSIFKAQTGGEYFVQQVPFARRGIGPGPVLNVLGEPVAVERYPWSRWVSTRQDDKAWSTLGRLASQGVFLPTVGKRMVVNEDGTRREMTRDEEYRFQRAVGRAYREFVVENRADLLSMPKAEAAAFIDKRTEQIRNRTAKEMFGY